MFDTMKVFTKPFLMHVTIPYRLQIEARAMWDEDADEWNLDELHLAGNRMRVRRPVSSLSPAVNTLLLMAPMPQSRATTRYATVRHQYEPDNPRFVVCRALYSHNLASPFFFYYGRVRLCRWITPPRWSWRCPPPRRRTTGHPLLP